MKIWLITGLLTLFTTAHAQGQEPTALEKQLINAQVLAFIGKPCLGWYLTATREFPSRDIDHDFTEYWLDNTMRLRAKPNIHIIKATSKNLSALVYTQLANGGQHVSWLSINKVGDMPYLTVSVCRVKGEPAQSGF